MIDKLEILNLKKVVSFPNHCKLDKKTRCWIWQLGKSMLGYGYYHNNGKTVFAHRFAYRLFKGKLTPGLTLDHLCRNRLCVNPNHLEEVTTQTNILRGEGISAKNAIKTHCLNGHEFFKDTTIICKEGNRHCKICHDRQKESDKSKTWHKQYARKNKEKIALYSKEHRKQIRADPEQLIRLRENNRRTIRKNRADKQYKDMFKNLVSEVS